MVATGNLDTQVENETALAQSAENTFNLKVQELFDAPGMNEVYRDLEEAMTKALDSYKSVTTDPNNDGHETLCKTDIVNLEIDRNSVTDTTRDILESLTKLSEQRGISLIFRLTGSAYPGAVKLHINSNRFTAEVARSVNDLNLIQGFLAQSNGANQSLLGLIQEERKLVDLDVTAYIQRSLSKGVIMIPTLVKGGSSEDLTADAEFMNALDRNALQFIDGMHFSNKMDKHTVNPENYRPGTVALVELPDGESTKPILVVPNRIALANKSE